VFCFEFTHAHFVIGFGLLSLHVNKYKFNGIIIIIIIIIIESGDSAVGTATSYRLDDRWVGVRVPVGSSIISSPSRPDRLWGPSNLLDQWLFPGGKPARAWS
jgi:hypothetical protein